MINGKLWYVSQHQSGFIWLHCDTSPIRKRSFKCLPVPSFVAKLSVLWFLIRLHVFKPPFLWVLIGRTLPKQRNADFAPLKLADGHTIFGSSSRRAWAVPMQFSMKFWWICNGNLCFMMFCSLHLSMDYHWFIDWLIVTLMFTFVIYDVLFPSSFHRLSLIVWLIDWMIDWLSHWCSLLSMFPTTSLHSAKIWNPTAPLQMGRVHPGFKIIGSPKWMVAYGENRSIRAPF